MGCRLPLALFLVSVILGVKTTPIALNGNGKINDETVKELESLKSVFKELNERAKNNDQVSVVKSETSTYVNINGSKSEHKEISSAVDKNGKTLAKVLQKIDVTKNKEEEPKSAVETEIDFPAKGIHHVIKNSPNVHIRKPYEKKEEPKNTGNREVADMNNFPEFRYRPLDVAEYVFWTGDEKSVALTIREFLEQGLMSRQQAINFLQAIKLNLDRMQSHYRVIKKMNEKVSEKDAANGKIDSFNEENFIKKRNIYDELPKGSNLSPVDLMILKSDSAPNFKQNSYPDELGIDTVHKDQEYSSQNERNSLKFSPPTKTFNSESIMDDDYEDRAERLKKTTALQEVIFELAKIMFSESLLKDNVGAQKAMQKFSFFLQNQVKSGKISAALEKKILDILFTALIAALFERPDLSHLSFEEFQALLDQNSVTTETLKQLLLLGQEGFSGDLNSTSNPLEKVLLLGKTKFFNGLLKTMD